MSQDPKVAGADTGCEGGGGDRGGTYNGQAPALSTAKITIGEALEAAGRAAADKPVDRTDAAAIAAAEAAAAGVNVDAAGGGVMLPGGVAAAAHAAADANTRVAQYERKTKLCNVLADATARLQPDKEATAEDASAVESAEMRSMPEMETRICGVASAVRAAAKLNEGL